VSCSELGDPIAATFVFGNEGRIEALFTLYFLALLVQALIEHELRLAMKRDNIEHLPLYPEQRDCAHPTTEQLLRLFSLAARNKLVHNGKAVQTFDVEFTHLQREYSDCWPSRNRPSCREMARGNSLQIASSTRGK
jgi:hypothetical protein